MKEFQNRIEIAPVLDIISITGTTLTMKEGRSVDVIFTDGDVLPGEKDKAGGGSRYYLQTLNVVSDKLASTLYNRYRNRKVVVKLFDDQDNEYLLGSLEFPARSTFERKLNMDKIVITCDTPYPLV